MRLLTLCCLSLFSSLCNGQRFRLNYDSSSIPELYQQTHIFLEILVNEQWRLATDRYRIKCLTPGALLNQGTLTYNNEIANSNHSLHFEIEIDNRVLPLELKLPTLKAIRIRPYTDSIKPVLDFYVPVEGVFSSGRIFPLSEQQAYVTPTVGKMDGFSWKPPALAAFEKVTFTAHSTQNEQLTHEITLYKKRKQDARDEPDYREPPPR